MQLDFLIALVVRVSGIFMALTAMKAGFFSYGNLAIGGGVYAGLWLETGPLFIMLLVSLLMISCPLGVARWLLPAEAADEQHVKYEWHIDGNIELLASSLMGLYFLVQSILDGFYVWGIFLAVRHMGMQWSWTPEYAGMAMASAAEFCAALWFLFGAKGLWVMVRWARKTGTEK